MKDSGRSYERSVSSSSFVNAPKMEWKSASEGALLQLQHLGNLLKSGHEDLAVDWILAGIPPAIQLDKGNPEVWSKAGDLYYYLSLRDSKRSRSYLSQAIHAYRIAEELAESSEAALPFAKKLIAAEEREGNTIFLEEFFALVNSEVKILTNTGGTEISVPDFNKVDNQMELFGPADKKLRTQFYISNYMSRTRVVLQMLATMDDDSLRNLLPLAPGSESPSISIVRVLPFVQTHLMSGIRALARMGALELALQDVAELWNLAAMVPEAVGQKDLSTPEFLRPELKQPFAVYAATLMKAFEKISANFYRAETWQLMKAYAKDSSKLSWAELLTLTQLAKFLMKGQMSPFEQVDLIEMRSKWATEGVAKLKADGRVQASPVVLEKIEQLFNH